jgi:CheY-like chemotaxis protein
MTDTKPLKILLVDDDKFLLSMYILKFEKAGFVVDSAPNPTVALEKIKNTPDYNIILSDIIMPGMDGIDFIKTVRSEKLCPDACVIMLTNEQNRIDAAEKLAVDGYVIKASSVPSEVVEKVLSMYHNKHKQ